MNGGLCIEFQHRPSAIAFMLRALRPSPGLHLTGRFPPIVARWRRHQADPRQLVDFLQLTGLRSDPSLPIIYPEVFGFRLLMVILTHPAFPLPTWNALQIRNHFLQHHPIPSGSVLDMESRVVDQRILEKGAEVDLYTSVNLDSELMWESLNTFYYRGRFGEPESASPLNNPPHIPSPPVAQWHLPSGVGWRFARMTGDYNGIHLWHWYARLLRFRQAFFHPQMILGQCMARLRGPDPAQPQRMDVWFKGPVYFNADVGLSAATVQDTTEFALRVHGDERPAILGRWNAAAPGERLLEVMQDAPANCFSRSLSLDQISYTHRRCDLPLNGENAGYPSLLLRSARCWPNR